MLRVTDAVALLLVVSEELRVTVEATLFELVGLALMLGEPLLLQDTVAATEEELLREGLLDDEAEVLGIREAERD